MERLYVVLPQEVVLAPVLVPIPFQVQKVVLSAILVLFLVLFQVLQSLAELPRRSGSELQSSLPLVFFCNCRLTEKHEKDSSSRNDHPTMKNLIQFNINHLCFLHDFITNTL